MEILFLYDRLLQISTRQLEAVKECDFERVEKLTRDRENVTGKICRIMENETFDSESEIFKKKAYDYTEKIINLDEEIKSRLLDELYKRTLRLSKLELLEDF
ncbi:MAG: hypothetical protein B6D63_07300 [Candidatus Latescibacteria bacterium 4484_7]|nr:MAG: hypothetical protein B6D63_07300 [Candidatus Latescibacteria bacterium 4484_7]